MNQIKSTWPPRVDGGSLPSIVRAQALEGELATVTRAAGRGCSRHCPHLQTPSAPPLGTHLGTSVAPYEAAHSLSYTLGGVLDSSLPVSFLVSFSQGCWLAVPSVQPTCRSPLLGRSVECGEGPHSAASSQRAGGLALEAPCLTGRRGRVQLGQKVPGAKSLLRGRIFNLCYTQRLSGSTTEFSK